MKIGIIVFFIGLLIFFGILAFFSGREDIQSRIDELKRPEPIDSLILPRPSNPGITEENPVKKELFAREKILNEVKKGVGSAGGEYSRFSESCAAQGGGVLVGVNQSSIVFECYKTSDDAGKPCRTNADCRSYNCNLQAAVDSGACILVKTDKYFDNQTYIYTYNCSNSTPGVCGKIPSNTPDYYWAGDTVIEYGQKFFPGEEDEFRPL